MLCLAQWSISCIIWASILFFVRLPHWKLLQHTKHRPKLAQRWAESTYDENDRAAPRCPVLAWYDSSFPLEASAVVRLRCWARRCGNGLTHWLLRTIQFKFHPHRILNRGSDSRFGEGEIIGVDQSRKKLRVVRANYTHLHRTESWQTEFATRASTMLIGGSFTECNFRPRQVIR